MKKLMYCNCNPRKSVIAFFIKSFFLLFLFLSFSILFSGCESDRIETDKIQKEEEMPVFSSLSEKDWIEFYQGLDRNKAEARKGDISIVPMDESNHIRIRANCTLEIKVEKSAGAATEFSYAIFRTGSIFPFLGNVQNNTWETVGTIDDTKTYDIFVQPNDGDGTEVYRVYLSIPGGSGYSFTMLTWDSRRTAIWLELDKLSCSP